ncbi:MAG TPA: hypothetical protein VFT70_13495 [Nocardioides sp.]|nr:hypothetical protein [Nocardioides sp.]
MTKTRTTTAAVVSAFALSLAALSVAPAAVADGADDGASNAPCARQQAQLDRAQAKYDQLQEKFAEHPTQKNKKAKKAQAQRVAHAQARLDTCEAAQPEQPSA